MSKTALITGSAKRIGHEIAVFLAKKGYDLVITYNKSQTEAQNLAAKIEKTYQKNCQIIQADLTNPENAEKILQNAPKNLNLLINNASIFEKSNFLDDEDQFEENLAIHLSSPLKLSRIFAKNAIENNISDAQIINFTDKNVTRHETSYFYYLLSKKFLNEATKMLALQLAPQIRVNAIAPGFILADQYLEKNPELATKIINKIPLQKKGEIANILQAIDFLLANNFTTGQTLFIDGGASLNHAG